MTLPTLTQTPQSSVKQALGLPRRFFNRIVQTICGLSISQKISCGYTLAVSLAVIGTTTSIILGHRSTQQARQQMTMADQERSYVARLQTEVLQTRLNQQQIILLLGQPAKLERQHQIFIRDIEELKDLFSAVPDVIKSQNIHQIRALISQNKGVFEDYFAQAEAVFEEVENSRSTSKSILNLRQKLIDFANSDNALKLDQFAQELEKFAELVDAKDEAANRAIAAAENLQVKIALVGIILSVAVAISLGIYTSQAIARPLKLATDVAQKITQDSNFDLKVPVITDDEVGVLAVTLNQLISQVRILLEEQKTESTQQLMQNEKMASLGKMMAGVAHEINNPINFIYGNLGYFREYIADLLSLLEAWEKEVPQPPTSVLEKIEEIDLEFLKEDLPKTLESMQFGAERVRQIILSLKDFSRLDTLTPHSVNLQNCIDSTLLILQNRIKKDIKVTCNYGKIPTIEGYTGFLYQVFMNILSNAVDALEEMPGDKEIVITTEQRDSDFVMVRIKDNGPGIPLEHQEKIFETFFTTKPRGVGTGLGLAISYQIVVEKHGGFLTVKSDLGKGTEFIIALPIQHFGIEKS